MKKIEFKIDIDASAQKVWNTMLDPVTYKEWVSVSWPGSTYEGKWEQGESLRFLSTSGEGTKIVLVEYRPYEYVFAKHVAVINADGSEDTTSDIAKGWIGTTESYTFTEKNGKTELKVELNTSPEWASMFEEGWPNALQELKRISER
jgi:uncharacterized protein YndB with AHSA1/START domain